MKRYVSEIRFVLIKKEQKKKEKKKGKKKKYFGRFLFIRLVIT